jgi:hypothetical protein
MTSTSPIPDRLAAAETFDDWPDPIELRDELPSVLPFCAELLPSRLRPWAQDISERMSVPLDLVAIPAMISAGSLIGRRVGIRPQRHTDWLEVGNLWGCIVARPGNLKSPAATEALRPLRRLEAEAVEEHASALSAHAAAEILHKLEEQNLKETIRGRLSKKQAAGDPSGEALDLLKALKPPELPQARRYLTSDVTAEKLGEICAANPQGVLVHRDELLSLFADLDHPERATARGFFMTGWGGQDPYTFDRIMRGTVHVPAVNISIFGTTQPTRLANYVRESIKRYDDGMVQRLQLLAWPDVQSEFREVDRHPDSDARRAAFECYNGLAKLEPIAMGADVDPFDGFDAVPYLRFADNAQEAFSDWRSGLEYQVRDHDLPSHLSAHFSKYRGLMPRLALICHLASGGIGPVTFEAFEMARRWIEYLETHARRAYGSTEIDNAEAARAIWRRVKRGDLPTPFTSRDIQRKGWAGLREKDRLESALTALVDADWLRRVTLDTGGRPTVLFTPNPKALRM